MKKISLLFATIALLAVSCKNNPNSSVEGTLRNSEKNFLKLEYLNINKTNLVDSIQVKKDGSFRFKVYVEQPGLYVLKNEDGKIINLLLSPNEKIKVESDYHEFDRNYSVMGSPESELIRQLVEKLTDTRNQLKELDAAFRAKADLSVPQANEYLIRRNEILKDQRDFSISFIVEHLSSIASIYALYQKLSPEELVLNENRDIQYMKIVADTLSVKYPKSVFVTTFVNDARNAEKRYLNLIGLQKKINNAQNGLPDITYPDVHGNMKSLSSLKGKTVLLYFWSVYSDACKEQNPVFEKIYKKYKNKGFEIFAVCIDKDLDNWLKMINFDELSFINTIGPDFPDSETAHIFVMKSIPSPYLLDKEGNIISKDLYGPELEKWLDNKL
jgi:thiol-disulfide isomerase/thioredoxin